MRFRSRRRENTTEAARPGSRWPTRSTVSRRFRIRDRSGRSIRRRTSGDWGRVVRDDRAPAPLTRPKEVCSHPAQVLGGNSSIPDRTGKLACRTERLDEAPTGVDKPLIFTQFAEMGEILRRHFEDKFGRGMREVAGSIVGSGEDWLTMLSTAELKNLFTLRREALGD